MRIALSMLVIFLSAQLAHSNGMFTTGFTRKVQLGGSGGGGVYTFTFNGATAQIRVTKQSDGSFVDLATAGTGNGWYATWTAPYTITSIVCNGAGGGGGGIETAGDAEGGRGGNGGYSAVATASAPPTLIYQAAGGAGGAGELTGYDEYNDLITTADPEAGSAGNKSTNTGLTLPAVQYRIYIGHGGIL